ncbi:hypothetical protein CXB51_004493 [Gossypium anomalum]|uniref:NADP-dependent oxidoreductase domain-containing protein n=1 Tax=Gossypium anomalum TaxID=47600 RepID=A0A8J6D9J5_9ROSI|nr:hypothetical protein CXB51_004493 [Gossypium anomalum]
MDNETLKEIANAHNKTVAQVCLRWAFEQGLSFVVKSFNKERMRENLHIFDWGLSLDDYKKFNEIKQRRLLPKLAMVSPNGPFKSLEELWDGEI